MSKEKLINFIDGEFDKFNLSMTIDEKARLLTIKGLLEEHAQQSEPKDNDVEGLALELYPRIEANKHDLSYHINNGKREAFIKGYNHNTEEIERLRKVNGDLVDALAAITEASKAVKKHGIRNEIHVKYCIIKQAE